MSTTSALVDELARLAHPWGVTADSFRTVVRKGAENREENKVMKGFEDLLDDQRIEQLYAYVRARSEGRLAPGRPHRPSAQQ